MALFDAIHSVDRPSLAEALAKEIARQGRAPLLFVEVNTGGEPQKAGVLPEEADAFLKACRETYGLTIAGLMCIPPADEPPAPHFALTAKIARAQWTESAFHGDERGFRRRDRIRRDPCAGRHRDFRRARLNSQLRHRISILVLGPSARQQPPQLSRPQRHAARRRAQIRPRHVHEHGAAAAGDARAGVVVDLDDEVVEPVVAPQPVAWFIGRAAERPVVAAVARVLAPGVVRRDPADRQQGARPRPAVGPPPQPQRAETARAGSRRRLRACWRGCRRGRARPGSPAARPSARRGCGRPAGCAPDHERKRAALSCIGVHPVALSPV